MGRIKKFGPRTKPTKRTNTKHQVFVTRYDGRTVAGKTIRAVEAA